MSMINKSLADHFPELIKSWHPDKNANLSPHEVAPKSRKRVWWKCAQGHEWQAIISSRTGKKPTGCPYCSGRLATVDNNLSINFPELLKEWHYEKNNPLKPNELKSGSSKKVWWICGKGHEWQAIISNRTGKKSGCPYCSGNLASDDNCLQTLYPELAKEWHPNKNGELSPHEVTSKSNKHVWWRCDKGHEWQAIISNRTGKNKTGCPYCSGKKATSDNNFAVLFPNLLKEWDYQKNNNINPERIMPYSHKKVWWKCEKGHEWQIAVAARTKKKSGCPYCSGRLASDDNCLQTLYPELAKEWHPTKNGKLTPKDVTTGTDRKVWWKCVQEHSWKAPVYHRTGKKPTGCPYCSGRYATDDNNLAVNFPELLKEWHYEKNNPLKPDELLSGSNKKVWWKCKNGHEWRTSPNHRTGKDKTGCPYCTTQTSRLEIRIYCEFLYLLDDVKWRQKINNIEVDIYIPKYSIGIEVDGYPWHMDKEEKDKIKGIELNKYGITLFRLREERLKPIESSDTFFKNRDDDLRIIHRLFKKLMKYVAFDIEDKNKIYAYFKNKSPQNDKEYKRFLSFLPSPPPEYSIAKLHKNLVSEWDFKKNAPLKPEDFTPGSGDKVWWKCAKDHKWEAIIVNRTKGTGCPYCAGKKVSSDNNLLALFPATAKEWHFDKNTPLKPEDFTAYSNKNVWWRCDKGHEWKTIIGHRTGKNKTGCPYCAGRKVSSDNNLLALFPAIAKEWHFDKNTPLKPEDFTAYSNKNVWWRCVKNHEWESQISKRSSRKTGCPYCAGRKVSSDNNLLVLFPAIAKEWHFDKNAPLKPDKLTSGSNKKVWWKCKNGHEWRTSPNQRTGKKPTGCPYCSGRYASDDNNLEIHFPELLKEWHYEKNNLLQPHKLLSGSNKKVWWICDKGHEWKTAIQHRTGKRKTGCPYCAGKIVSSDYNLEAVYPKIAKEWNYKKNEGLIPKDVAPKSGKKFWWRCTKGHEWQAVVANRTVNKTGCPYCAGKKVSTDNNLAFKSPHLLKEWHFDKNESKRPDRIYYRSTKKVWWRCQKGHEWEATPQKRVLGTNCPYCSGK